MRIRWEDEAGVDVDLAPLIDCVFLLLIFFLVASSLRSTEFQADLPQQSGVVLNTKLETNRIVVEIQKNGRFEFAGKKYPIRNPKSLGEGTRAILNSAGKSPVEIRAHPTVSSGQVLILADALRLGGIETVDIRVFTEVF